MWCLWAILPLPVVGLKKEYSKESEERPAAAGCCSLLADGTFAGRNRGKTFGRFA